VQIVVLGDEDDLRRYSDVCRNSRYAGINRWFIIAISHKVARRIHLPHVEHLRESKSHEMTVTDSIREFELDRQVFVDEKGAYGLES
jgi:hypothetical protein